MQMLERARHRVYAVCGERPVARFVRDARQRTRRMPFGGHDLEVAGAALREPPEFRSGSPGSGCATVLLVMTSRATAGVCLWILVASAPALAQERSDTTSFTFPASGFTPFRRVERTTESGGRKVIIERVEAPSVEGKWEPLEEVVSDTTRAGNRTTSSQRDLFRLDLGRQPRLAETTQSEQETQANGSTRNTQRTWVADLDGRLTLSSGYVAETTVGSPGRQQSNVTWSRTSPEGSLREVERTESTEHQVNSAVARRDSTYSVRDLNGRWVPTEARSGQTRGIGSAERVEEETIQRQNLNGTLVPSDEIVTRTSESNGEQRVVIETYSQNAEGFVRSDSRLALRQRVRRSTTVTADGGRSTVEEIEARNPLAPNDPMRVTRRTLVTVRSVAPDRWVTERQMFERDANGHLILVAHDTEETTEK